jgi:hypothetical protein
MVDNHCCRYILYYHAKWDKAERPSEVHTIDSNIDENVKIEDTGFFGSLVDYSQGLKYW